MKITEKIKKLLRLAKSSNRHEAELAMQRAFEIAARHHISLDSIDVDEDTRRIIDQRYRVGWRITYQRQLAIMICINYFNVNCIEHHPDLVFVGTATDIAIATHVFEFLTQSCNRSLRAYGKYNRRKLSTRQRRGFIQGFFYGVASNLRAAKAVIAAEVNDSALILARDEDQREAYVSDNFTTVPQKIDMSNGNKESLVYGHMSGKNVRINTPVNAVQRPALSA